MAARRTPRMRLTTSVAPASRAPVFQQVQAHRQGGVFLLLEGRGGVVGDLHHLRGVPDLHAGGEILLPALLHGLQDIRHPAHQDHVGPVFLMGRQGPLNQGQGGVVSSHSVHDDFHA